MILSLSLSVPLCIKQFRDLMIFVDYFYFIADGLAFGICHVVVTKERSQDAERNRRWFGDFVLDCRVSAAAFRSSHLVF